MANLIETSNFDEGIYRIETTDPVIGGETGIANKAAKGLANRTKYLFDWLTTLVASFGNAIGKDYSDTQATDKLATWNNIYTKAQVDAKFVNQVIKTGNITVGNPGTNQDFPVTFANTGRDYIVTGSMVGLGGDDDATVYWNIKSISRTGFTLHVREAGSFTQDLRFDYALIGI